jgi:hypothetical protein
VVADGARLPFRDKAIDFAICSHVLEHVDDPASFCAELERAAHAGYVETPGPLAETVRHAPNHRWLVRADGEGLAVRAIGPDHPLGPLGKLFFSVYFYGTNQVCGRDVYAFARGAKRPWHYMFSGARLLLTRAWLRVPRLTYTRVLWWRERLPCVIRTS